MRRFLSTVLSLALFANQSAAQLSEARFWSERRAALGDRTGAFTPVRNAPPVAALAGPSLSGLVNIRNVEGSDAGGRVLYVIEDVHRNDEAQRRIAGYLDRLARGGGLDAIGLEGAFGPIDIAPFRRHAYQDSVRAVADYGLVRFRISGPVHLALTRAEPLPPLVGVDDHRLYDANVAAYRRAAEVAPSAMARWGAWHAALLARPVPPALRAYASLLERRWYGNASLAEHLEALASLAPPDATIAAYLDAVRYERRLSVPAVERERRELIARLAGRLPAADLARLGGALRSPSVHSLRAANEALVDAAARAGIALSSFPAVIDYLSYLRLADGIDVERLLASTEALEIEAGRRLAATEPDRRFVEECRRAHLTERLLHFALTRSEWSAYADHPVPLPGLAPFESFYRAAEARDAAMAASTLSLFARGARRVAVVAGGFHANALAAAAASAGIRAVSAAPRMTSADRADGSAYLTAFASERAPLERLFDGRRLFLSDHPDAGLPGALPLVAARDAALGRDGAGIPSRYLRVFWSGRLARQSVGVLLAARGRLLVAVARIGAAGEILSDRVLSLSDVAADLGRALWVNFPTAVPVVLIAALWPAPWLSPHAGTSQIALALLSLQARIGAIAAAVAVDFFSGPRANRRPLAVPVLADRKAATTLSMRMSGRSGVETGGGVSLMEATDPESPRSDSSTPDQKGKKGKAGIASTRIVLPMIPHDYYNLENDALFRRTDRLLEFFREHPVFHREVEAVVEARRLKPKAFPERYEEDLTRFLQTSQRVLVLARGRLPYGDPRRATVTAILNGLNVDAIDAAEDILARGPDAPVSPEELRAVIAARNASDPLGPDRRRYHAFLEHAAPYLFAVAESAIELARANAVDAFAGTVPVQHERDLLAARNVISPERESDHRHLANHMALWYAGYVNRWVKRKWKSLVQRISGDVGGPAEPGFEELNPVRTALFDATAHAYRAYDETRGSKTKEDKKGNLRFMTPLNSWLQNALRTALAEESDRSARDANLRAIVAEVEHDLRGELGYRPSNAQIVARMAEEARQKKKNRVGISEERVAELRRSVISMSGSEEGDIDVAAPAYEDEEEAERAEHRRLDDQMALLELIGELPLNRRLALLLRFGLVSPARYADNPTRTVNLCRRVLGFGTPLSFETIETEALRIRSDYEALLRDASAGDAFKSLPLQDRLLLYLENPETLPLDLRRDRANPSLEACGAVMGVTKERVRQIESKALVQMRSLVGVDADEAGGLIPSVTRRFRPGVEARWGLRAGRIVYAVWHGPLIEEFAGRAWRETGSRLRRIPHGFSLPSFIAVGVVRAAGFDGISFLTAGNLVGIVIALQTLAFLFAHPLSRWGGPLAIYAVRTTLYATMVYAGMDLWCATLLSSAPPHMAVNAAGRVLRALARRREALEDDELSAVASGELRALRRRLGDRIETPAFAQDWEEESLSILEPFTPEFNRIVPDDAERSARRADAIRTLVRLGAPANDDLLRRLADPDVYVVFLDRLMEKEGTLAAPHPDFFLIRPTPGAPHVVEVMPWDVKASPAAIKMPQIRPSHPVNGKNLNIELAIEYGLMRRDPDYQMTETRRSAIQRYVLSLFTETWRRASEPLRLPDIEARYVDGRVLTVGGANGKHAGDVLALDARAVVAYINDHRYGTMIESAAQLLEAPSLVDAWRRSRYDRKASAQIVRSVAEVGAAAILSRIVSNDDSLPAGDTDRIGEQIEPHPAPMEIRIALHAVSELRVPRMSARLGDTPDIRRERLIMVLLAMALARDPFTAEAFDRRLSSELDAERGALRAGANIPVLRALFTRLWLRPSRRPADPAAREAAIKAAHRRYARHVSWWAEAPFSPGLGGWMMALALSRAMPGAPLGAWIVGHAIAAAFFIGAHFVGADRRPGWRTYAVALGGFAAAATLWPGTLDWGPAARIAGLVALLHFFVENLDPIRRRWPEPRNGADDRRSGDGATSRRDFERVVGAAFVNAMGLDPLAVVAGAVGGSASTPTGSKTTAVAAHPLWRLIELLEGESPLPLINRILAFNSETKPGQRAEELAAYRRTVGELSRDEREPFVRLARIWSDLHDRVGDPDALLGEARTLVGDFSRLWAHMQAAHQANAAAATAADAPVARNGDLPTVTPDEAAAPSPADVVEAQPRPAARPRTEWERFKDGMDRFENGGPAVDRSAESVTPPDRAAEPRAETEWARFTRRLIAEEALIAQDPAADEKGETDQGPSLGAPPAETGANLPFLRDRAARWLVQSGWAETDAAGRRLYGRFAAWVAELPFMPGVGGALIAGALTSASLPAPLAWASGQAVSFGLFVAAHYRAGEAPGVRLWSVATGALALSLWVPGAAADAASFGALVSGIALLHLSVENADLLLTAGRRALPTGARPAPSLLLNVADPDGVASGAESSAAALGLPPVSTVNSALDAGFDAARRLKRQA